jgi:hypothetical protein
MIERIGDVVEIGSTIAPLGNTIIALRGIITIVDGTKEKIEPEGMSARYEPCTTIVIEGGQRIYVTQEDGAFVRRYLKDYEYERERAARKALR